MISTTLFDDIQQTKGPPMSTHPDPASPLDNNVGFQNQQYWSTLAQYIATPSSSSTTSSPSGSLSYPQRTLAMLPAIGPSHMMSGLLELDVSRTENLLIRALRTNHAKTMLGIRDGNNPMSPSLGGLANDHETQLLAALLRPQTHQSQSQSRSQSMTNMNNTAIPQMSLQTMLVIERAKRMAGSAPQTNEIAEVSAPHPSQKVSSSNLVLTHQQERLLAPLLEGGRGTGTSVCRAQSTETDTSTNKETTSTASDAPILRKEVEIPTHGEFDGGEQEEHLSVEARKQQKRAANRISAQQSRKRKQQFIDELKEENEALRKVCRVLSILPDLAITFDSAGIISFVSPASEHVFGLAPDILIGQSFWNLICPKSTRKLKAAFMDALAASRGESSHCSSVFLGAGNCSKSWQIRIKNKKNDLSVCWVSYALHGVVHFEEGSPECVCTMRKADEGMHDPDDGEY